MKVKVLKRKSGSVDKMLKHFKKIQDTKIDTGYFADSGIHESGMTYAELMNIHEYGLDVPARPLLHITSDMVVSKISQPNYATPVKNLIGKYENVEGEALKIGIEMTKEARDIFGDGSLLLENSPRTNNPTQPLIDTGELKANIGSRVNGGGVNKQ